MQILFRVGTELYLSTSTQLIYDLASSTNMNSYKSTIGTGASSQKSSTFAISHSEAHPARPIGDASKC